MNRLRALFLLPAWAFTLLLFLGPLLIIVAYSLRTKGVYGGVGPPWTLENYVRLFDPLYGVILLRSFLMAAVSTLGCLALAFPLAYYIARSGRRKTLLLNLVMLPFWTSFLVRTYAWMFLLRDTGLINSALLAAGLITEPLPLLYNDGAVIVGLIYGYLPFAVLPLYSNLERLDKSLLEAAADLGARPSQTLLHIVLPLTAPGLRAAGVLVFIPCLGAYLTPDLLGGGKSMMIGNLVQNQFTSARDWPFGSALSLALMAIVMFLLWTLLRRDGGEML
ncbi:MAG: ABC transporter permease [Acidobacteriota bacterium]|jgi:spermidine/putrescine transport system permease protein|nr:ABC transporter permease [Bryobacteraceae bacterium CoA2 C42]